MRNAFINNYYLSGKLDAHNNSPHDGALTWNNSLPITTPLTMVLSPGTTHCPEQPPSWWCSHLEQLIAQNNPLTMVLSPWTTHLPEQPPSRWCSHLEQLIAQNNPPSRSSLTLNNSLPRTTPSWWCSHLEQLIAQNNPPHDVALTWNNSLFSRVDWSNANKVPCSRTQHINAAEDWIVDLGI